MTTDPFAEFKGYQREMWASFAPAATFTTPVAAHLVRFAGVRARETVLDVGTGTGVAAITARRAGAQVKALDLAPALLARGREDAKLAGYDDIEFTEGDAEKLPYPDASFDVVLSQFGHMFAPRPEVAIAEIRRVLKPGGRVAFATWAHELFVGRFTAFVARHMPPPPGAASPSSWGNPAVVAERLGGLFAPPLFDRGTMQIFAVSLPHVRALMETSVGPLQMAMQALAVDPERLAKARREFEALAAPYYDNNIMRQDYLLTLAEAR